MAKPKPAPRNKVAPTDRAIQFSDLDAIGKTTLTANVRELGNVKSRIGARIESQAATAVSAPGATTRKNAARNVRALTAVAPHVKDAPITMQGAASRRAKAFEAGTRRSREEGVDSGAGWYFEHHRALATSAQQHGFDTERAITAAAVMSPQNSPENERAAVHALMDANARRTVSMTPDVHRALGRPEEHGIGDVVPVSQLNSEQVARMSDVNRRARIAPHTDADVVALSRGGTNVNIARANEVLRGEVEPSQAIPPGSGPKIHSYRGATQAAVPDTPVHREYMDRVTHAQTQIAPPQYRQQRIDVDQTSFAERWDTTGHRDSTAGILNPRGGTAEDTWMNALTMGQPMRRVTLPDSRTADDRTVVGKHVASDKVLGGMELPKTLYGSGQASFHPAASVTGTAGLHAFNNEATIRAAAQVGRRTGTVDTRGNSMLPSVAMQEVSWTEVRRASGKDPVYNQRSASVPDRSAVSQRRPSNPRQGSFF